MPLDDPVREPPSPRRPPLWRRILLLEKTPGREPAAPDRRRLALWKRILLWNAGGPKRSRWRRYLLLAVLCNLAVWSGTFLFLKLVPPTYTSEWTLVLPGSGASAVVSLQEVGQVRTSSPSAYSHARLSPKVTYQSLAQSDTVLAAAAAAVGMTPEQFGKPRVSLIQQTTLMEFSMRGPSPAAAQQKARALNNALQLKLRQLRLDEVRQREAGHQEVLENIRAKMLAAERALLEFQIDTGLVSVEQYLQLAVTVDEMRKQTADLRADHRRRHSQVEEMASILGVSPALASDALTLESDGEFMRLWQEHAEASSLLTVHLRKWGPKHAKVKTERARQQGALEGLKRRSRELIGRDDMLDRLTLSGSPNRSKLFSELIAANAQRSGVVSQLRELRLSIDDYSERLKVRGRQAAQLSKLQREHELAEAVFTSAQARIDTVQSDLYASFPLLQTLASPSLPKKPSAPKKKLVLAGAAAAVFFCMAGLLVLWIRQPYLQRILKNG